MVVYKQSLQCYCAAIAEGENTMAWYMISNTRCRNMDNAMSNLDHGRRCPAVIRRSDGFYDVTRLSRKPVQPGQFAFIVQDGEHVYNEDT